MRLALPRPADFTKKVKKGVGREVRTWRKGFRKQLRHGKKLLRT